MKYTSTICLLALAPSTVLSACNADNVLRALRANSAKASPFCSTYTQPPPDQPLPTYVSQYPASRVSSACSCLVTIPPTLSSTSSSSTTFLTVSTPPPTPTSDPCKSNRITNGDFQTLVNNVPASWFFAGEAQTSYATTVANSSSSGSNYYASFYVKNNPTMTWSGTTYINQNIPALCRGTTYKLTYSSQITIINGSTRSACSVRIALADQELVFLGPPNGAVPPFTYETREATFTYTGYGSGNVFTVEFSCTAPQGYYKIDDISLVGV